PDPHHQDRLCGPEERAAAERLGPVPPTQPRPEPVHPSLLGAGGKSGLCKSAASLCVDPALLSAFFPRGHRPGLPTPASQARPAGLRTPASQAPPPRPPTLLPPPRPPAPPPPPPPPHPPGPPPPASQARPAGLRTPASQARPAGLPTLLPRPGPPASRPLPPPSSHLPTLASLTSRRVPPCAHARSVPPYGSAPPASASPQ